MDDQNLDEPIFDQRICQNCSYFFHHLDDEDSRGICSLDPAFDAYQDDESVFGQMDFSVCRDLYLEKCFDDQKEACESFDPLEYEFLDDQERLNTGLELLKSADTSELFSYLHKGDPDIAVRALDRIALFIRQGNTVAFNNLICYCQELGPATTLDEVHYRIELVDILAHLPEHPSIIDVFVQELARTPSNNTTRKLYTNILNKLNRYPKEDIEAPLIQLLEQVPYSYKIKRRIMEVAGLIEPEEEAHGFMIWY